MRTFRKLGNANKRNMIDIYLVKVYEKGKKVSENGTLCSLFGYKVLFLGLCV